MEDRRVNVYVKSPFKHDLTQQRKLYSNSVRQVAISPDQEMFDQTVMSAQRLTQSFTSVEVQERHQSSRSSRPRPTTGKLVSGRLLPLHPVTVEGPTIEQCRGIIAGTRPSSTLRSIEHQRKSGNERNREETQQQSSTLQSPSLRLIKKQKHRQQSYKRRQTEFDLEKENISESCRQDLDEISESSDDAALVREKFKKLDQIRRSGRLPTVSNGVRTNSRLSSATSDSSANGFSSLSASLTLTRLSWRRDAPARPLSARKRSKSCGTSDRRTRIEFDEMFSAFGRNACAEDEDVKFDAGRENGDREMENASRLRFREPERQEHGGCGEGMTDEDGCMRKKDKTVNNHLQIVSNSVTSFCPHSPPLRDMTGCLTQRQMFLNERSSTQPTRPSTSSRVRPQSSRNRLSVAEYVDVIQGEGRVEILSSETSSIDSISQARLRTGKSRDCGKPRDWSASAISRTNRARSAATTRDQNRQTSITSNQSKLGNDDPDDGRGKSAGTETLEENGEPLERDEKEDWAGKTFQVKMYQCVVRVDGNGCGSQEDGEDDGLMTSYTIDQHAVEMDDEGRNAPGMGKLGSAENQALLEVVENQLNNPINRTSDDRSYYSVLISNTLIAPLINAKPERGFVYYFAYGPDINTECFEAAIGRSIMKDDIAWGLLYGFKIQHPPLRDKETSTRKVRRHPRLTISERSAVQGRLYLITAEESLRLYCSPSFLQTLRRQTLPVWLLSRTDLEEPSVAQYCLPAIVYASGDILLP